MRNGVRRRSIRFRCSSPSADWDAYGNGEREAIPARLLFELEGYAGPVEDINSDDWPAWAQAVRRLTHQIDPFDDNGYFGALPIDDYDKTVCFHAKSRRDVSWRSSLSRGRKLLLDHPPTG